MIRILFVCLELAILHSCVSDLGYQCTNKQYWSTNLPAITLIEHFGVINSILNSDFKRQCEPFYDITTQYSLERANKDDNVIYFAVPDYYDRKLLNDFDYAGNVSDANEAVCNETGKIEPKFDCHEIANFVSRSVLKLNDGDLYDYIQKMKILETKYYDLFDLKHRESCKPLIERKTSNLTTVVICLDETLPYEYMGKVSLHPLKLVVPMYNCKKHLYIHNDHLLAVLAPKPFEVYLFTEYSVPTIFYDIPFMFSEYKIAFPNSLNVVPWRLLKYGFLKFMQSMGWQRVVIVTDDSEYSLEFENELIALFNKERIVYTVIRCEDANCEMDKIKQELSRVSAKIVIANFEEDNAYYLFENSHNITWLVRDMARSNKEHFQHLLSKTDVFSISLRAVKKSRGCDLDDNILTGLSSIALAYKDIGNEDFAVKISEFYRRFTDNAEQISRRNPEAVVVVNKLEAYFDWNKEISRMYVNESGAEVLTFKDPYGSDKPSDGSTHCFAKSYDYFKPCEDSLVLLLIGNLLLFVITFLMIVFYFHKTSPFNDI